MRKSNGKLYWPGLGLDALLESDLNGNSMEEYIFFAGRRVARRKANGAIEYYFADHLGSSRVVTNATGTVLDRQYFLPFGWRVAQPLPVVAMMWVPHPERSEGWV